MFLKKIKRESAISLTIAMAGIIALAIFSAHFVNAERTEVEQRIIKSALNDALAAVSNALGPNTYWDAAYDHVVAPIDSKWAIANLGPYALQTSHMTAVIIFNDSGKPIYAYAPDSLRTTLTRFESDAATKALMREALRSHAVPPAVPNGLVQVDGKLYLAAAALVVPNDARAVKPLAHRAVEIYLQEFNPDRIMKVERDFGVSGVRIGPQENSGGGNFALRDAAGDAVGFIQWDPQQPGTTFLAYMLPGALLCMLLLGLLQLLNLSRWHSAIGQLEHNKAEAVQLRRDSWARSMFMANISHELRTPLNAIIGFSDMIAEERLGAILIAEYKEYAENIKAGGTALLAIVNDILYLTQKHDESLPPAEPCLAGEICAQAIFAVTPKANEKGVRLLVVDAAANRALVSHGVLYRQVAICILENAIKFSAPGQIVRVTQSFENSGGELLLIVEDAGCGIPPESIPYLGQPFFQVKSSFNRAQGVGLGLAIAGKTVKNLGGTMSFASEPGIGTTVRIRLPASPTIGASSSDDFSRNGVTRTVAA